MQRVHHTKNIISRSRSNWEKNQHSCSNNFRIKHTSLPETTPKPPGKTNTPITTRFTPALFVVSFKRLSLSSVFISASFECTQWIGQSSMSKCWLEEERQCDMQQQAKNWLAALQVHGMHIHLLWQSVPWHLLCFFYMTSSTHWSVAFALLLFVRHHVSIMSSCTKY